MKHKKLFVRLFITCLVIIALNAYIIIMTIRCEGTVIPDNITPKEIIYLLETYWNNGNEKGISMLCSEGFNIANTKTPYSFSEDILRKEVHITECEDVTQKLSDADYPQLYDKHCYRVLWNCEDSYEIDWRSGGFAFILIAKESNGENVPYKICAMFTGL